MPRSAKFLRTGEWGCGGGWPRGDSSSGGLFIHLPRKAPRPPSTKSAFEADSLREPYFPSKLFIRLRRIPRRDPRVRAADDVDRLDSLALEEQAAGDARPVAARADDRDAALRRPLVDSRASPSSGTDTAPGTWPAAYSPGRRTSTTRRPGSSPRRALSSATSICPMRASGPPGARPTRRRRRRGSRPRSRGRRARDASRLSAPGRVLRDEDDRPVRREERARPRRELSAEPDVDGTFGMPRAERGGRAHVDENRARADEVLDVRRRERGRARAAPARAPRRPG